MLALLLTLNLFSIGYQPFSRFTLLLGDDYSYSLERFTSDDPLTLESFERDQYQFSNYEEFLAYLSNRAPEIFQESVLLHTTGSIQKASKEIPRVLLFGRSSILSFSGEENTNRIEMIEFDPTQMDFSMGVIRFDNDGTRFESNPSSCIACHGESPKPLWAPYDIWPKAFGSRASFFASEPESQSYETFRSWTQQSQDSLYRRLELPENPDTLESINSFTQFVASLNSFRVMKTLGSKKRQLEPFRYALAAIFQGCTDSTPLSSYLPEELFAKMPISLDFLERDVSMSRMELKRYLERRYLSIFPGTESDFSITDRLDDASKIVAEARFIFEAFAFSWRSFTTGIGENDYAMNVPGNFQHDFLTAMVLLFPEMYSELRPEIFSPFELNWVKFQCDTLQTKSLEALAEYDTKLFQTESYIRQHPNRGLTPIGQCAKCHAVRTTGFRAPYIPFDDTMKLRSWLRQDGKKSLITQKVESGEMPKGEALSEAEKQSVLEVIEILSTD